MAAILFGIVNTTLYGPLNIGMRYWVASSGNLTDEVWKKYIKNQQPPESDDNFIVAWRSNRPKADLIRLLAVIRSYRL